MRNFLRDITISTKISLLTGLTVLLMTAVIGLGLRYINTIGNEVTAIAKENIPLLEAVSKITYHSLEQSIHLERAIQFGKHMAQDKAAKDNFEIERKNFLKHAQMIAQEIEKNRVFVERMSKKYLRTHRGEKRILQVDYVLRSIGKECADYQFLAERVFNLFSQGKLTEAEPTIQKIIKESKEEEEEHFQSGKPLENLTLAVEGFAEDSIIRIEEDKQTALFAMLLVSASILLFSLGFGIFISHGIRKPLNMAVNTAERIAAGERNFKIEVTAKDETGQLLQALKTMSFAVRKAEESLRQQASELEQSNTTLQAENTERKKAEQNLQTAQKKLIDTARQVGMAETATDVLHNVGNVLNSVSVTTASIRKRIRDSKVSYLTQVVGLLGEHADDLSTFMTTEERGRKLPAFLTNLSKELIAEQERSLEALETLTKHVEHMAEIIQLQQSYSKTTSMVEPASVVELVEDAIRINAEALTRHGVEVKREFADLPHALLDHHKVLQILTNLISNAKYALSDSGRDDKILTICITEPQGGHFRIEVHDNGVGITKENLTRIFEHGFTTKKHGYGFGLHSAAIVAKEMNGSLTAHSDGHGKGTVFTLELPFQTQEIAK